MDVSYPKHGHVSVNHLKNDSYCKVLYTVLENIGILTHFFMKKMCYWEENICKRLEILSLLTVFLSIPLNYIPYINHRKLPDSFVLTVIILTVPADPSYPDILNVNTKVTSLFYVLGVVHKVCQHFFFFGGGGGGFLEIYLLFLIL